MFNKACTFRDWRKANEIMLSVIPYRMKRLGRRVSNFDEEIWAEKRPRFVAKGLYAKFSQNEKFAKKLLATDDKLLGEASARDKIWGIGLEMEHPDVLNPYRWTGENLLGKSLMMTRHQLQQALH